MSLSIVLACSLLIGALSATLAYRRARNPYLWFFIGFIFGLFGVFAIFLLPLPTKKELPQPPAQPQPYIDGPGDRFWYYLDPSSDQQGPMSRDALTHAWKKGEVHAETFVWHEDLSTWKPLQELIKYR